MPHVTIEYSAALDQAHDLQAVCEAVFATLAAHDGVPHPETLKVRAIPCPYARIGTEPQTFAHARLGLLAGRSDEMKALLTNAILHTMAQTLPDVGSLSVDCYDLSAAYTKRVL